MPTASPSVRVAAAIPDDPSPASLTGRAVILALVVITLVVSLAMPVREFLAQRARAAELTAQTAAAERRIAELTVMERRWEDPMFVAARARERLGMARPGEVALVVADPVSPARPAPASAPADDRSWLERLWRTVTRAQ